MSSAPRGNKKFCGEIVWRGHSCPRGLGGSPISRGCPVLVAYFSDRACPERSRRSGALSQLDRSFRTSRCRYRPRIFPLVLALLIRARNHRPSLQELLDQIGIPARRALLRNRLMRRRKLAFRITSATIKCIALARPLLDNFSVLAQWALHANKILLDVLAFRVSATGCKFPIPSVAQNHVAITLRALLVEWNIRNFLALIQPPRRLAIRISRTRHELPESTTFQNHYAAAILAIFFLRRLLRVGCIQIRQRYRIFFRKSTAIRILFVVRAARKERTVLAPT